MGDEGDIRALTKARGIRCSQGYQIITDLVLSVSRRLGQVSGEVTASVLPVPRCMWQQLARQTVIAVWLLLFLSEDILLSFTKWFWLESCLDDLSGSQVGEILATRDVFAHVVGPWEEKREDAPGGEEWGCCYTSHNAWHHHPKNHLASNVNGAEIEELCVTLETMNSQLPLPVSGLGDL